MKIAICGSNPESNAKMVKDFMSMYSLYKSPGKTIFDEEVPELENMPSALFDTLVHLNDKEKELYMAMQLLNTQYDKYEDKGFIIYNGCPLDVLVHTIANAECSDDVDDEFVEKIIYWSKKLIKKLDLILWLPDKTAWKSKEVELENGTKVNELYTENVLEKVYNNLYTNYMENFSSSIFFDHEDCPGYIGLESDDPMAELQNILDSKGGMDDDDYDDLDVKRVKKVLRNPELIKAFNEGMEHYDETRIL